MRTWRGIIVHHTAGRSDASAEQIDHVHRTERGFRAIGYHWLVRYDRLLRRWTVEAGRPETDDGAHCPGKNRTHLGVALAGDYRRTQPPTLALSTLVMLLTDLCARHSISPAEIRPHSEYRETECPGDQMRRALPVMRGRVADLLPVAEAI